MGTRGMSGQTRVRGWEIQKDCRNRETRAGPRKAVNTKAAAVIHTRELVGGEVQQRQSRQPSQFCRKRTCRIEDPIAYYQFHSEQGRPYPRTTILESMHASWRASNHRRSCSSRRRSHNNDIPSTGSDQGQATTVLQMAEPAGHRHLSSSTTTPHPAQHLRAQTWRILMGQHVRSVNHRRTTNNQ